MKNTLFCLFLLFALSFSLVEQSVFAQARPSVAGTELDDTESYDEPRDAQHTLDTASSVQPAVTDHESHEAFARAVDVSPLKKSAIFNQGRTKILDTVAREHLQDIYGRARWRDDLLPKDERYHYDPIFTYLDLIFNKPYYIDKAMIYVQVLPLRETLVADMAPDAQERWLRLGRLSYRLLHDPATEDRLHNASGNLQMQQAAQQVMFAKHKFEGSQQHVALISPAPGETSWVDIRTGRRIDPKTQQNAPLSLPVRETWQALGTAWRAGDVAEVNELIETLATQLPQTHPETYPAGTLLQLEWLYNVTHKFTIGWVAYAVATICLLLAFHTQRRKLAWIGGGALLLGFAVHTGGMIVRGVLSGRWPIHNQFESFMAVSWFAVLVAIILLVVRRQWLFGAAAAALGTAALMVANTFAIPSNEVGPVAGILATSRILYIHVNIVLISYAMISLGFFISLLYLAVHYLPTPETTRLATSATVADGGEATTGGVGRSYGALLNDLDKAQLTVLQIAFYLLGVGILLGAYWADHAWGRWWGWDPKETWALITWIIYLIAIHVRLAGGVKNRGLVTAWLSVLGFCAMLWCYWGVNMLLAGLHSYA